MHVELMILAGGVAAALSVRDAEEWAVSERGGVVALTTESGLWVRLSRRDGRIRLTGLLGDDAAGRGAGPTYAITTAATAAPEVIAGHALRRLLPAYRAALAEARAQHQVWQAERDWERTTAAALQAIAPGSVRTSDRPNVVHLTLAGRAGRAEVAAGHGVTLQLTGLDATQAAAILRYLRRRPGRPGGRGGV